MINKIITWQVRVPPKLNELVHQFAKREEKTISSFVRDAVRIHIGRNNRGGAKVVGTDRRAPARLKTR